MIKPRAAHGGLGVLVCPLAEPAEIEERREVVPAAPERWVAQPLVELSTHPTLVDGELSTFVFMHGPGRPRVMPGGLTRFAVDEDAVVVNSTRNGGFKDTWVLAR